MKKTPPSFVLVGLLGLLAGGCHSAHAPTVDVLGSYFPAWLICIVAGVLLTAVTRQLFIGLKLAAHLRPAPVVYLCLLISFTLAAWLIFFKN